MPLRSSFSRPAASLARSARMGAGALAAAALPALGGCQTALMTPAGPVGAAERTILLDSLAIMLVIVVPTIVATLAVAWWFRASNGRAKRRPQWAFSGQIELVVWSVPLMTILLLGGVTWIGAHQLDPAEPITTDGQTLHVQVVSLDWKWLFIYPDQQVATVNELVLPTGVPVRFSLTSASVMSTFFVPRLGSMIYTMNGMSTTLHLRADQDGAFRGLSTMVNGEGFSDMHFAVRALPKAAFDGWLAATRQAGGTLDAARYTALAQQSVIDGRLAFAGVEAGLYDRIVDQSLPPGPGPGLKNPGATRSVLARP